MIRILIVEDELPIANLIRLSLSKAGYTCDCVYYGAAAADQIAAQSYDLILLDVMLPEVDGFTLLEYIRPYEIPVIFLTAKNAVQDRVKGLRLYHKNDAPITIAGLEIDPRSMQVRRNGVEIPLTRKEYDLLLLFARNPNIALYRETIYRRVWGGEFNFESKTVDLHVLRLRRKVGWEGHLRAIPKVGYRLEVTG